MYVIRCRPVWAKSDSDCLFVNSTAYKGAGKLNFGIKILKYAKKFRTTDDARKAMEFFNPSVAGTTFEVIPLSDALATDK